MRCLLQQFVDSFSKYPEKNLTAVECTIRGNCGDLRLYTGTPYPSILRALAPSGEYIPNEIHLTYSSYQGKVTIGCNCEESNTLTSVVTIIKELVKFNFHSENQKSDEILLEFKIKV